MRQRRRINKNKLAPFLRKSYYGRKRLLTGMRHFVSSVIEYSVGAALESSHRKIPFFSLLVSSDKPTKKNKVPNPMQADVICDTGASISLVPISITRKLRMRVNNSRVTSVQGADGQKLSSMGTTYVYMKVPASPSWLYIFIDL